jgi:general secretion pathway protein I
MRRARGLTLLEVLIALAVLAIGVTSLQRLLAGGIGTLGADARLTRAMLAAQGLLAEASLRPPELGHVEGDRPGSLSLHWERDVTTTPRPTLREVRVRVYTDAGRRESCELVEVVRVPSG